MIQDEALATRLIGELNQSGKEQIRDLVKNPLLLTLICLSWQNHQGALPKTRAGLYRECVEAFYNWDDKLKPRLRTTEAQQEELNRALGELAKKVMDRDDFRFRLTKAQVREFLGHADEGLFKLALDVGWLNEVGLEKEDPSEEIYAFLHPTFQEYFAALVIDDSKFFLDHVPENPDLGAYRIFEQQWKEVFLIWLERKIGSDKDENAHKEVDDLLLSMIDFNDNCENLFGKKYIFDLAQQASSTYRKASHKCPSIDEVLWDDGEECQTIFSDRCVMQWFNHDNCSKYVNIFRSSKSKNNQETAYEYRTLACELGIWIHQYGTCTIHYPIEHLEYQAYEVEHQENIRRNHTDPNNFQFLNGFFLFLAKTKNDEMKTEYYEKFNTIKMDNQLYKEDVDLILQCEDPHEIYHYLDSDRVAFLRGIAIRQLTKLIANNEELVSVLIDKIENDEYPIINLASVIYIFGEAHLNAEYYSNRLIIVDGLCYLSEKCENLAKISLLYAFYRIVHDSQCCKKQLCKILASLKPMYFDPLQSGCWTNIKSIASYLLTQISLQMTYPEFYKAWHQAPATEELLSLQPSQEPNFLQLQTDSLNQEEDPQKLLLRFNIRLIQALPATLKPQFKQRLKNCQDIAELEGILIDLQDALPDLVLLLGNRQPSPQLKQLARQLQDIISIDWDR